MNQGVNKSFFALLTIKILFLGLIINFILPSNKSFGQSKKKVSVVVIDAGHGGKDPGAQGNKLNEKDIVLAIALKLGALIEKNLPDVKVIYTRETDVFVELFQRAEIANKNQADLFISIHSNSNKSSNPYGVETYFMGETKAKENLDVAKKENDVILIEDNYSAKYDGYDPKSAESVIIFSLFQKTYQSQSLNFASLVQNQFKEHAQREDRGVKQAGFLVLWKTVMPSVLVETGFISNPAEAKFLKSEHGQDLLANSIYKAFRKYKTDIENRSIFVANGKGHKDSVSGSKNHPVPDNTIKNPLPESDTIPNQPIEFFVQISSSIKPIPLKKSNFKGMQHVEELHINQSYKYVVGRNVSYKEVYDYLKVVKNYFPDAFLIAVRNGKIIPVREALKEIKD